MQITIAVSAPNKPKREIKIANDVVVGRGATANLRIVSNEVSREHCRLIVSDERVAIRDLGSSNGTQLDGKSIEPETDVLLASGSRLDIGPLKLVVKFDVSLLPKSFAAALQAQNESVIAQTEVTQPMSAPVSVRGPAFVAAELAEPIFDGLEESDETEVTEPDATVDLDELPDTVAMDFDEVETVPNFAAAPEFESDTETILMPAAHIPPAPVFDEPPAKRKGLFSLFRRDKKADGAEEKPSEVAAHAMPANAAAAPPAATDLSATASTSPVLPATASAESVVAKPDRAAIIPASEIGLFPPDQDEDWDTELQEGDEFDDNTEPDDDDVDPGFANFLNDMK